MKWGNRYGLSAVTAILIVFGALALAQDPLEILVNQTYRPTIRQLHELYPQGVPAFVAQHHGNNSGPAFMAQVEQGAPALIAFLEQAYPGAIWAALGRDSFMVGDLLDAFYQSLGQVGRVVRVNMSGPTVSGASDTQIVQLLQDQGWDPANIQSNPAFIIFDNTSYDSQSQSTKIMNAVYQAAQAAGNRPHDLIRKLNLMSTASGVQNADLEAFFAEAEAKADQNGRPHQILHMGALAANWMYGLEWHGSFNSGFTRDSEGKLCGIPGSAAARSVKEAILSTQSDFIWIMSNPTFLEAVKREALALGYVFPVEHSFSVTTLSPEEREQKFLDSLKERLAAIEPELTAKPEQTTYLSANGEVYLGWLESAMAARPRNSLCFLFMKAIVSAHAAGKIGDRDIRRLMARTIGRLQLPDETFAERFSELFGQNPGLQKMFVEKRAVFTESKQKDAPQVSTNFVLLEETLRCRSLLAAQAEPPLAANQ